MPWEPFDNRKKWRQRVETVLLTKVRWFQSDNQVTEFYFGNPMENYVLYDEVGRGEHSVVYKGRKKGSIEFVAIHCVEKCKRFELQNMVRLTHELDHRNVVQFHEWYETTNHIWMVAEFCTGGSLDTIISQDLFLPEETVKQFGAEIVKGLSYIHSLGILYCDLRPSRIMLDGPGVLKLGEFALARVEGEDDFYTFQEDMNNQEEYDSDDKDNIYKGSRTEKKKRPKASPQYMAPEVLRGEPHSKESDLWSLGCLLYQLFTGRPPFLADTFAELAAKIFHEDFPEPEQMLGNQVIKPSGALMDLISKLLIKDPAARLEWAALVKNSIWEGALDTLLETSEGEVDGVGKLLSTSDEETEVENHADISDEEIVDVDEEQCLVLSEKYVKAPSFGKTFNRPESAPVTTGIEQGTYTFSSRPHTTVTAESSHKLESKEMKVTEQYSKQTETFEDLQDSSKLEAIKRHAKERKASREKISLKVTEKSEAWQVKKPSHNGSDVGKEKKMLEGAKLQRNATITIKGKENTEVKESKTSVVEKQSSEDLEEPSGFILHESDFVVSPIADNPRIKKTVLPKCDAKALPCAPLKPEEVLHLTEEKMVEHLASIQTVLSQSDKASGGQVASVQRSKLHTATYLASLCRNGDVANTIFESGLISVMLQQLKRGFSSDYKARLGYALGLLASNATLISENFNMTEVFTTLTEVIRDNFRNARLKQLLVPALGEFLFYAAMQEENESRLIPMWDIPGLTFTIINRCLREGEDVIVQHYAAKTVENVTTTQGRHCVKFASNDTAQLLWNFFTHCTVDAQKVTAVSALCHVTKSSPGAFQHVIEKAGFKAVVNSLTAGLAKVQQAVVTMFLLLLSSRPQARRVIEEKGMISKVMHLFENPSTVVRGKAFLMVELLTRGSKEALLSCCHARLVMYIERDMRRQTPVKGETPANYSYLKQCLNTCVSTVIEEMPDILSSVLAALDAVQGRKHPSAAQAKQLRISLPLLSVVLHLITSHVFRHQIITDVFLADVGSLLSLVKSIDSGCTSIGSAAGPNAADDLSNVAFSIVEAVTQHPPLLLEFHAVMVDRVLPPLATLVSSANGNTRVLCFRMFSDVASLYLDNQNMYNSTSASVDVRTSTNMLNEVISQHLLPQYNLILQDQDPLPAYGLKLLLSFVERSPEIIRMFLDQDLLLTLAHISQAHAGNMSPSLMQSLVGLLECVVSSQDIDISSLYEQGLIDTVTSLFVDIATAMNGESMSNVNFASSLLPLLDTVNSILKNLSKEVRRAIQAKNQGEPDSEQISQFAEKLLLESRPLAELTGVLINFLCYEDEEVQDWSCRSLYLMAELFGGVYEDAMSEDNIECLAEALGNPDIKRQKQLLRVIKRFVTSNPQHAATVIHKGQALIDSLNKLKSADSSSADAVAVQGLVEEIFGKLELSN